MTAVDCDSIVLAGNLSMLTLQLLSWRSMGPTVGFEKCTEERGYDKEIINDYGWRT